jgi:hypothetical protein
VTVDAIPRGLALGRGFDKEGAAKILGGNYRRVFAAMMAGRQATG